MIERRAQIDGVDIIIRTDFNPLDFVHYGLVKGADKAGTFYQVDFDPEVDGAEKRAIDALAGHIKQINAALPDGA